MEDDQKPGLENADYLASLTKQELLALAVGAIHELHNRAERERIAFLGGHCDALVLLLRRN